MHKIPLLHVTSVPITLGFLRGQVGFMKAAGFEVSVASSPGELLTDFAAREDVPSYPIEISRRISPMQDLKSIATLCKLFKQVKPTILHAHTPKAGLLCMIAGRICGVPVRIYHVHGLLFGHRHDRLLTKTERVACGNATKVFCVSKTARQIYIDMAICPDTKITTFLGGSINGIDAGYFDPAVGKTEGEALRKNLGIAQDDLVIGFVGRLVRDKGLIELHEAWLTLKNEFPNLHLVLAGPLESEDPLPDDVVQSFESDPRVHLMGFIKDPRPVYAVMDILALPTYREGLPYAPLEAQCMEVPVVATDIPGCNEAIGNGQTGSIIPLRDSLALTQSLREYLTNGHLRREQGIAGRKRMLELFAQVPIWQAMEAEYRRLIAALGSN